MNDRTFTVRQVHLAMAMAISSLIIGLSTPPCASEVTFNREIVRIFQQHCQVCHRPGEIAPFSLTTYQEAYAWRHQTKDAVQRRRMPPWKPIHGIGEFRDGRRLSDGEISLIAQWVDSGAPKGNPRDLPPPRQFPKEWALGSPDLVLSLPEFRPDPAHMDVYRCFVVPTNFGEDRYVAASEIRPGNRKIVHHVLTFIDTTGAAAALDRADPGPGYSCFGGLGFPGLRALASIGTWVPGASPHSMPPKVGILLPARAHVVVQVHYAPRGLSETDRSRIGLYFDKGPVEKTVQTLPVWNRKFTIPAGAERHEVTVSRTVARNQHAISIFPHMHLLGREMKVEALYPDGSIRPLIAIADWDFNWQGFYYFKEPIPLPAGTQIKVWAVYDNSAKNPRNPNSPPKDVRWGMRTTDEMCLAWLMVTADAERLTSKRSK